VNKEVIAYSVLAKMVKFFEINDRFVFYFYSRIGKATYYI